MNLRLFILLSAIFAILQGPLLPSVFLEGLLVVFLLVAQPRNLFLALFAIGVVFDLFQSQTLGVTSLIFLGSGFFYNSLRANIAFTKPIFLALLVFLINFARSYLVFDSFLSSAIIIGVVAFVIFYFLKPRVGFKVSA